MGSVVVVGIVLDWIGPVSEAEAAEDVSPDNPPLVAVVMLSVKDGAVMDGVSRPDVVDGKAPVADTGTDVPLVVGTPVEPEGAAEVSVEND